MDAVEMLQTHAEHIRRVLAAGRDAPRATRAEEQSLLKDALCEHVVLSTAVLQLAGIAASTADERALLARAEATLATLAEKARKLQDLPPAPQAAWDAADGFAEHRQAMLRSGPTLRRLLPPPVRQSLGLQLEARLREAHQTAASSDSSTVHPTA